MDLGLLVTLPLTTIVLALLVALLSGVVKGAIGFAMPLIIVSGLSSLIDPKLSLAAIIVPIVFSNILQTFRQGLAPAIEALKDYWRYVLTVCAGIFVSAQLVPVIPSNVFYWVIGVPVVALSLIQLAGLKLEIEQRHRSWSDWLVGCVSGMIGGLAGTWGPTTILYLLAISASKSRQIIVQGVVYGAGSITLLIAHIHSGILNTQTAPLSFALLPAAILGMWLGFKIQDRLNQQLFRKITLIVLIIAGLNLLRKGFVG